MALWDEFGKKASEATAKTMQKAKELQEITRLNSLISDEEKNIDNVYYQLGKRYVSLYADDCEDAFTEMLEAIRESKKKIEDYKKQVHDVKGVLCCKNCGAEIQKDAAFCSSCGCPIPKVEDIISDDCIKCENCGAVIKKGTRFCTSCGTPIIQQAIQTTTQTESVEIPQAIVQEVTIRICPRCGTKITDDAIFCTECGMKL